MSELYNRIYALCTNRGVSVTTMCKESGASRASLSDLKAGRNQNLSADTLSKIATYFHVSVDYLLGKAQSDWSINFREQLTHLLSTIDSSDIEASGSSLEELQQIASSEIDLSFDRACDIADLLGVSFDFMIGRETEKEPTVSGEPEIDMSDVDIAFYGDYKELSDDDQKTIRDMVRVMRERRANNGT